MNLLKVSYSPTLRRGSVLVEVTNRRENLVAELVRISGSCRGSRSLRSSASKWLMIMTVVTELVETMDDPVGDDHGVLIDARSFYHGSVHTLAQLGLVKIKLRQQFQRAVNEDCGRSAVLEQKNDGP